MESTMVAPSVAGIGFFAFILMGLFVSVIGSLLTVLPIWKICDKAGFPGVLSLLMLVPIGNIILPFYIAFARWPALPQRH